MPFLRLEAYSANFSASVSESTEGRSRLTYRVRLTQGQSVSLETGEDFDDLEGSISLFNEKVESDETLVGLLNYFEGAKSDFHSFPPSYQCDIYVPKDQFSELLMTAQSGRIPKEIAIDVKDMEFDWHPDGSGKKWKNKTSPSLVITAANFSIPLANLSTVDTANAADDDEDDSESSAMMPPTRLQIDKLASRFNQFATDFLAGLKWLIIAMAALAIVAVFHTK